MKGISAALSLFLLFSVFSGSPASAGRFGPSATETRATPVSGIVPDTINQGVFQLNDGTLLDVVWGGLPDGSNALWFRVNGKNTPWASSSGRVIDVQNQKYSSCQTKLLFRPEFSGTFSATKQNLVDDIFVVQIVEQRTGKELYTVARARDLFVIEVEDTASQVFVDKNGGFFDQTPVALNATDGIVELVPIQSKVQAIAPSCN
jgi:hypothetical protein